MGVFENEASQAKKGGSWHQRNARKHFLAADNQFPHMPEVHFRAHRQPRSEIERQKKEDKQGRADKYCYRICHHGKARQIEATKSKKRRNARKPTELTFREARKCHHRKISADFCVEKISFDYNKTALFQSVYTTKYH